MLSTYFPGSGVVDLGSGPGGTYPRYAAAREPVQVLDWYPAAFFNNIDCPTEIDSLFPLVKVDILEAWYKLVR